MKVKILSGTPEAIEKEVEGYYNQHEVIKTDYQSHIIGAIQNNALILVTVAIEYKEKAKPKI